MDNIAHQLTYETSEDAIQQAVAYAHKIKEFRENNLGGSAQDFFRKEQGQNYGRRERLVSNFLIVDLNTGEVGQMEASDHEYGVYYANFPGSPMRPFYDCNTHFGRSGRNPSW